MLSSDTPSVKSIHTLDLKFRGLSNTIAAYLIPHSGGAVLIETGPGSTIQSLQQGLQAYDLSEKDVTDVLLTHIHLDHAGAAGWLAKQGARIYVHEVGAPHMLNPEKLLASATRIYGEATYDLWGDFLPVPEKKLFILRDGDEVEINGLIFRALDIPGHAIHHLAYIFQDVCFSGDIGGVRLPGYNFLRLPMPPPDLNLELWRCSLELLQREYQRGTFHHIAPTHFGIYGDPAWHLARLQTLLNETESWIVRTMSSDPSIDQLRENYLNWSHNQALAMGVPEEILLEYEAANPIWMSAHGIYRYWHKVRT